MADYMDTTGTGADTTWHKVFRSSVDYRDIMWTDIIEIAREHWRWVITQSYARTHQGRDGRQRAGEVDQSGTCLVAILFVPSNTGAYFFLSTIPRPTKQREMRARGYRDAIAWWNAVHRRPDVILHAEDAVEYDFEKALRTGLISLPHIQTRHDKYYKVQDRDNEYSRLKIAVWGCYQSDPPEVQQTGRLIELCTTSEKRPRCHEVARTLHIEYCTWQKVDLEEQVQKPGWNGTRGARGPGAAGPSSGPSSGSRRAEEPGSTGSTRSSGGSGGYGSASAASYSGGSHSARARDSDVSQLAGKMSSLSVAPGPAKKQPYWVWDPKKKQYYHTHSDGSVSVRKTGE